VINCKSCAAAQVGAHLNLKRTYQLQQLLIECVDVRLRRVLCIAEQFLCVFRCLVRNLVHFDLCGCLVLRGNRCVVVDLHTQRVDKRGCVGVCLLGNVTRQLLKPFARVVTQGIDRTTSLGDRGVSVLNRVRVCVCVGPRIGVQALHPLLCRTIRLGLPSCQIGNLCIKISRHA